MKTIKVSEATGPALDWLVTSIEDPDALKYGVQDWQEQRRGAVKNGEFLYRWSDSWAQGGPIIEREGLTVRHMGDDFRNKWLVRKGDGHWEGDWVGGHTPLIAAMRCYVVNKLGDAVQVPEEL